MCIDTKVSKLISHMLTSKRCLLATFLGWIVLCISPVVSGQEAVLEIAPPPSISKPFTYSATTTPAQIPLCMVGDSITWVQHADVWRKVLLEHLPRLAFIGTHSAKMGYSHAGEGGDGVAEVLTRLDAIPDCPYYSLHIGTNSNGIEDATQLQSHAARTAKQICDLVTGLLQKKNAKKVFLCSIIPCDTKNPLRDETNSATNTLLRSRLGTSLPRDKVVWVEIEKPVRAIENWRPKIKLHPTPSGYRIMARILADHLVQELEIEDCAAIPVQKPNTGVRIHNLWDAKNGRTSRPIIAGWYVVSFELKNRIGAKPRITIRSCNSQTALSLNMSFDLAAEKRVNRVAVRFFTGHEDYDYTRDHLTIWPHDCEIDRVLFEKRRPAGQPSPYGKGCYVDTLSLPSPGELVEAE